MKPEKLTWDHWREDLSVGIEVIDDDHKRILSLIATLSEAFRAADGNEAGLAEAIRTVTEYSERHFAREESILAAAGYPFLDQHRLRHQSFRAFVANTASGARPASAPELFSYLVDWWVGHIATDDKSYREFLDGKDALIAEALAEVQAPTIVMVAPKREDLAGFADGARPEDYRDRIDRV